MLLRCWDLLGSPSQILCYCHFHCSRAHQGQVETDLLAPYDLLQHLAAECSREKNPRWELRDIRCSESRTRRNLHCADPFDLETQTVVRCMYGGVPNLTADTPFAVGRP